MILALAGRHESKITSGEYGPLPRLRGARAVRVDPEPEDSEGLGPERLLRHVSGNRAGARILGEQPDQMTNDQFPNPNGTSILTHNFTQRHSQRDSVWSLVFPGSSSEAFAIMRGQNPKRRSRCW